MRILIETQEHAALASLVTPAVTGAPSTIDAGGHDAGAAPAHDAVTTVPGAATVIPATNAGGPPDWLVEAIGSPPATQSNSISNGFGIDGGQGL